MFFYELCKILSSQLKKNGGNTFFIFIKAKKRLIVNPRDKREVTLAHNVLIIGYLVKFYNKAMSLDILRSTWVCPLDIEQDLANEVIK